MIFTKNRKNTYSKLHFSYKDQELQNVRLIFLNNESPIKEAVKAEKDRVAKVTQNTILNQDDFANLVEGQ